jgi:hypothetical protein
MDFVEVLQVVVRRWRVSLPMLLLVVGATAAVAHYRPAEYQSDAEISLVGSHALANEPGNGGNVYVALGALSPLANILASDVSSDEAAQQLRAMGMGYPYTAEVPAFAGGPFVELTVTGNSVAGVRAAMPVLIKFAQQELVAVQQGSSGQTPGTKLIQSAVIAAPSTPTASAKKRDELIAGVAIAGVVAVFLLSVGAEKRARYRLQDPGSRNAEDRQGSHAAYVPAPNGRGYHTRHDEPARQADRGYRQRTPEPRQRTPF